MAGTAWRNRRPVLEEAFEDAPAEAVQQDVEEVH